MQLTEAAQFLHVTTATLERWVRQGLLLAASPAGGVFSEDELERWARERGLPHGGGDAQAPERTERLLSSAVARGSVRCGVHATSASQVIELALAAAPGLADGERDAVLARVLERERMAGTGLGNGIALPHPRQPLAGILSDPVVSIVHLAHPVDWASLDGKPVQVALLLLSPNAPVHLQLLSRVSLVLRQPDVPAWMRSGPGADALVDRIRAIEEGFDR